MPSTPHLTAERTISLGIRLLETLSHAPGQAIGIKEASEALGVPQDAIPSIVDTLSAMSDRSSGARAAISLGHEEIKLIGDSARVKPLRLSIDEGMVLAHILDGLDVDEGTRERVRRAIMPLDGDAISDAIAEAPRAGRWFSQISEAIEDGIRCRFDYRSLTQAEPTERVVDPIALQEGDDASYLIGWDVAKDAERRYRLDRIERFRFTDDSVAKHDEAVQTAAESLRSTGKAAWLVADNGYLGQLDWAGIGRIVPLDASRSRCIVYYSSEAWLFDQVLSSAGNLVIAGPEPLRDHLTNYARELLGEI